MNFIHFSPLLCYDDKVENTLNSMNFSLDADDDCCGGGEYLEWHVIQYSHARVSLLLIWSIALLNLDAIE